MCTYRDIVLNDENGDPLAIPTKPLCSSAWVDPSGKFYPVRDCGHCDFALFHFNTTDLESRGWVHVSFGNLYTGRKVRQSQLDTLYDVLSIYEEHGYDYAARMRQSYYRLLEESNDQW